MKFFTHLCLLSASLCAMEVRAMDLPLLDAPESVRSQGAHAPLAHTLDRELLSTAPAQAWLGHHGGNLIAEFHVSGVSESSDAPRDDLAVFEGAAVEVFIGSAGDAAQGYYHFASNPRGSVYDEFVRDEGWTRDPMWDSTMTVTPLEVSDGWAVRMSIPLAVLRRPLIDAPPLPDFPRDLWFQLSAAAISHNGEVAAVTWSPSDSSFHNPAHFARVRLAGEFPPFGPVVARDIGLEDDHVVLDTSIVGTRDGSARFLITGDVRRTEGDPLELNVINLELTGAQAPMKSHVPIADAGPGRYFVTRLYGPDSMLLDQLVQDWFYRGTEPVIPVHERFHDSLPLLLRSSGGAALEHVSIVNPASGATVWETNPEPGPHSVDVDTSAWPEGVYELRWKIGGESHAMSIARTPAMEPIGPGDWTFWGYAPDEELLAEFAAFAEIASADRPMVGFIYGGSVDPVTGALSALNVDSIEAWKSALPEAEFHLMIDGGGNFDLISDDQVERIAAMIVEDLMPNPSVDGLHLDLEPYRASQVRLTRALTRLGWSKPISLAVGLATTVPPEQWRSIDFMVAMNYDLGKTPEVYERRATQNARAFARAARDGRRPLLVGLPAIATHNEYGMVVEAATGDITEGSIDGSMLPYVEISLRIIADLQNDPELGPFVAAPALWAGLARGHHVGQRRYRYFPTTITGDIWSRLIEFDAGNNLP